MHISFDPLILESRDVSRLDQILSNLDDLKTLTLKLTKQGELLMASIDDLNKTEAVEAADIASLKSAFTTYQQKQAQTILDLQAELAKTTPNAAVDAAVAKLQGHNTDLEGFINNLGSSVDPNGPPAGGPAA